MMMKMKVTVYYQYVNTCVFVSGSLSSNQSAEQTDRGDVRLQPLCKFFGQV